MLQLRNNRSAFTLIELLVVVIIVAVLASVGIPLLSANIVQARASEGVAGLGTIRTALRAVFAETTTYDDNGNITTGTAPAGGITGIAATDLDGRFFNGAAYSIFSISGTAYCVAVDGDSSGAPQAAQVAGVAR